MCQLALTQPWTESLGLLSPLGRVPHFLWPRAGRPGSTNRSGIQAAIPAAARRLAPFLAESNFTSKGLALSSLGQVLESRVRSFLVALSTVVGETDDAFCFRPIR